MLTAVRSARVWWDLRERIAVSIYVGLAVVVCKTVGRR